MELAERLCALTPISAPTKAAFFNSGAEAVENAVKIARAYTQRPAVIAFEGGFHGRTLLAMTLTSKTHPYKAGFGPFAPEVYRVPFANDYRGPDTGAALAALERAFVTQVAAEHVAAIVIEPIQGEGGFVVAPSEFMAGIRSLCDEHGILLIVDEVQTGFGRTGRMFAIEHYDVEPDLMVVAKSIAGGLPLSGVLGRAEIMDAPGDSAIGGTYVGNPVAQAAALAVLDVIDEEALVARASAIGEIDPRADAPLAGALPTGWRRTRPRGHARHRARPGPGDEAGGPRAGHRRRGAGDGAGAAAAQVGAPGQLHPRPRSTCHLRRGARRGARRVGRGARNVLRLMRREDETTLDLLRKVPLFEDCSPDELRQIASIADELSFREGKILTRQGGPGREMFILLEGKVKVERNGEQINTLGPGEFLGEGALVLGKPRNATITSTSPLRALVISEGNFKQLLRDGRIAGMVHETLAARTPPEESD